MKKIPLSLDEVKAIVLRYEMWQPIMIGPICVALGPRGFEEVTARMNQLVDEGVIRPLTDAELERHDIQEGYRRV